MKLEDFATQEAEALLRKGPWKTIHIKGTGYEFWEVVRLRDRDKPIYYENIESAKGPYFSNEEAQAAAEKLNS
ncbi:MAG: hypothetical protein I3I94_08980 [Acidaminococcaceae bacterium]|nr:hypothetical protein [Acidaminococcaceae bacterium]